MAFCLVASASSGAALRGRYSSAVRVIAGVAKGARLGPVPRGTRPVSDRVREGLFSSLGEAVVGGRVFDPHAGTGGLGVEGLSRGGARATFVARAGPAGPPR